MTTDRAAKGARAEAAVADWLVANGYVILARNARVGKKEIDIVARRGGLAVIVEVRTRGRGAFEGPFASVAGKKRMLLLRAAHALWRTRLSREPGVERMRIDVAAVHFDDDGATHVDYAPGAITADR